MWDHIINIHLNELLRTKTKKPKINEHKKKKNLNKNKKFDDLHFLPNNILTIFFKELTIYRYIYI